MNQNKFRPMHKRVTAISAVALLALAACSESTDVPHPGNTNVEGRPVAIEGSEQTSTADAAASGPAFQSSSETASSIAAMPSHGTCSLESVVSQADNQASPGDYPNTYKVQRGQRYHMVGFATNKDKGSVPEQAEFLLSGLRSYVTPLTTGGPRQDVADYFQVPAFANAGYTLDIGFSDVAPGEYSVYVIERGPDGAGNACPTHQSLTVVD